VPAASHCLNRRHPFDGNARDLEPPRITRGRPGTGIGGPASYRANPSEAEMAFSRIARESPRRVGAMGHHQFVVARTTYERRAI
jgi:hypothetical protein